MDLTQNELSRIFRAMASLLHAGITPGESVYLLAREETGEVSRLLQKTGDRLDGGEHLSTAMGEAFPGWTRAMVAVGEKTGHLEEALEFLGASCDEAVRTRRLLKQSFGYPLLLFVLMLSVIGVLLVKVLPVFDRVYASLGTGLTGVAGGLLVLGQGLEASLPVLSLFLLLTSGAVGAYRLSATIKNYVNQKARDTLGDRGILRKFNNARFARALAMGIASGLTEEEALSLAGTLLEQIPGAARRCAEAEARLEEGANLAEALAAASLLPPARSRMLAVGLRGGNGDRVLADIACRMEEDARQALEDGLAAVEPAMVLTASALVGLILLSVMVPLLDILSALGW